MYIFVQALLGQQTATYISIGSLAFTTTVPRAVREKTALLMQFYTDYLQGTLTLRQYIQRVAYRVAPTTRLLSHYYSAFTFAFMNQLLAFL